MSSNAVTIKFSRNARIEENIDVAKITLDKFIDHKQGQPLLVRYYKNVEKEGRIEKIVDTLVVIGTKDGRGRDCYSILTTSGEREVNGIYDCDFDSIPDVSLLVSGAIYISRVNNVLSLVYIGENGVKRYVEPITENTVIFKNLEDGYRWFYYNNKIRREDDILDADSIQEIIDNAFYTVNPMKLVIEPDKDTYKIGEVSSVMPIFKIYVYDYKGEEVTNNCTIKFYIGGIEEKASKYPGNRFIPFNPITETTKYTIKAEYRNQETSEDVSIKFLFPSYYGKAVDSLTEIMWDKETNPSLELIFDLNDELTIFKVPYELDKILDSNSLDYIDDYTITRDGDYYIYVKKDSVKINNFKQIIS
jgi:hypothetical protein